MDGAPVLARKQSFLSLSSRRHQRVLSVNSGPSNLMNFHANLIEKLM
jgi:hypothetical protein